MKTESARSYVFIVEYVELHKMASSKYFTFQKSEREKNWTNFSDLDPDGQALFLCITSIIKASDWAKSNSAAKQISGIFRSSCLAHHATPVSIMEKNEIQITGLSQVTQQYQLISCIAKVFNLNFV